MAAHRSKAQASSPAEQCPCGSGVPSTQCSAPYHTGTATAPTAEALMRSRYTAFALGRSDYLLATWHPDTRPADLTPDTPPLRWLGLVIHAHHAGQATDTTGTVQFTARYKAGGRAGRLTETSRFVRLAGRWVYLEGDVSAS